MITAAQAQTQTGTEAPGGAAKAPFPPFNQETFGSQLFWLAICFVVLYVLLARWALPRVSSIFTDRRDRMEGDVDAARRLTAESEAAIQAYEKALADARGKAQAIANTTRAEFSAKSEETKRRLDAELAAKLADAERTIEATKKTAMANVRNIATDAAGEIVRRLVGDTPNKQSLERAVDAALH